MCNDLLYTLQHGGFVRYALFAFPFLISGGYKALFLWQKQEELEHIKREAKAVIASLRVSIAPPHLGYYLFNKRSVCLSCELTDAVLNLAVDWAEIY